MTSDDTGYAKVEAHYDALAANGPYATLAPHNKGGRKSEYVAAVFDAVLLPRIQILPDLEHVLDFGCGTGIFTRQVAVHAREVIGTDLSSAMLELAAHTCDGLANVRLLHTDGIHIPLPDGYVDMVVARETLCYASDAQIAPLLEEILRVTKAGGAFLWLEQVSNDPCWQHHPRAPYVVKRSPESLRNFAKRAGWLLESEQVARTPRFPWIYPVQAKLIPRPLARKLARWEAAIHSRRPHPARRWWNALFVLRKPADG